MPIFRSLSIVMVAAILFNAMAPTLAYAATYLQGAEVNADTLGSRCLCCKSLITIAMNKQKSEKGWIDAIAETTFRNSKAEHFLERRPLLTTKCCQ